MTRAKTSVKKSASSGAAGLSGLLMACASGVGFAQEIIDTPVLYPAGPAAGQMVDVQLHGNACVLYLSPPDTPYTVVRLGNTILLTVQAYVAPSGNDLCIYPNSTVSYSIGAFESGKYAVQVSAQYQEFLGDMVTQDLGALSFTVGVAHPVPALDGTGLLFLALSLAAAAMIAPVRRAASLTASRGARARPAIRRR